MSQPNKILISNFFDRDAQLVARELLGKVIRHRVNNIELGAMIIETEAYYIHDKASHASLGYTEKRKALFMPAGTIYMYYARGGDSLNVSCRGDGNAVLIKAGIPHLPAQDQQLMLTMMQALNPIKTTGKTRPIQKLCSGQTLLCKSLGIKVKEWDQKQFVAPILYVTDVGYHPPKIVQTTRLGIPQGRDEHLPYRFIDAHYVKFATRVPSKI